MRSISRNVSCTLSTLNVRFTVRITTRLRPGKNGCAASLTALLAEAPGREAAASDAAGGAGASARLSPLPMLAAPPLAAPPLLAAGLPGGALLGAGAGEQATLTTTRIRRRAE